MNFRNLLTFCAFASLAFTSQAEQILMSPLDGERIIFVAEAQSVVKKGEVLAEFSTTSLTAKVAKAKATLEAAKESLEIKKINYDRYQSLKEKNSASAEKLEDVYMEYQEVICSVSKAEADLAEAENNLALARFTAPYDCKVTLNLLAPNSGAQVGSEVLVVEPLITSDTAKVSDDIPLNSKILTSSLFGGIVTYTPEVGSTLKKGEVLARLYDPTIIYIKDYLKAAITMCEHNLLDKQSKYKRYQTLSKSKSTSVRDLEIAETALNEAKYKLQKAILDYQNNDISFSETIHAPYDCKVTKVFLLTGSGTQEDTSILEIVPFGENPISLIAKDSYGIAIGGTISDGYPISELPKVGDVIKKGEQLVKYISAQIEVDLAANELEWAKFELKDKERSYKRCRYLTDNKSESEESLELQHLEYEIASNRLKECEADLIVAQEREVKTTILAPYDCVVSKVMLIPGSGTTYGLPILEIIKYSE